MADHLDDAVNTMVLGHERWTHEDDILAGRASLLAARALIEFLVGRNGNRNSRDVWPTDYASSWSAPAADVDVLRVRLAEVDRRLAHLSLERISEPDAPTETWSQTVTRIVDLFAKFAREVGVVDGGEKLRNAADHARQLPTHLAIEREKRYPKAVPAD
jgi:hypothetical protein